MRPGAAFAAACLLVGAAQALAADCAQITTWSNADQSFFPAERIGRIERNNTPGFFYFDVDNVQDKLHPATYFTLRASPSLTRDQRFTNAFSVTIMSFASAADATAVYQADLNSFYRINPVRWGFSTLVTGPGLLAYYASVPGDQDIWLMQLYGNTVIRLALQSSSDAESVDGAGATELSKRLQRARDLVDAKCGTKPNSPPSVTLVATRGDETFQESFQRAMAQGRISIMGSDPDGREDIDWSTFTVHVAGIDKTLHALEVVRKLIAANRFTTATAAEHPERVTFELRLDPRQLMGEHNLFNIAWNGHWPIRLRVCDRQGACGSSDFDLYFGPFVQIQDVSDLRCLNLAQGLTGAVIWGNNGYAARANFYVLLGRELSSWATWTSGYLSLSMGLPPADTLVWLDASFGRRPVFAAAPVYLDTGAFDGESALELPRTQRDQRMVETLIPSGQRTLAYGAVDLDTGAWYATDVQVRICARG